MVDSLFDSTNALLLERLQSNPWDESAWDELVRGYSPAIRRWCRGWGLQAADADDVTQAVLVKLAHKMAVFRYDRSGSFRGYLKSLTRYAVADALELLRLQGLTGDTVIDWLAIEDTRNELARCLETEFRQDLFREALSRVARRVDPKTMEIFLLLSRDRRTGAEVAALQGKTVAAVYMAKSRVIAMVREEIRTLSRLMAEPCE